MPVRTSWIVPTLGALVISPLALAGPDWDKDIESDAGSGIVTAQIITFNGVLQTVQGKLNGTAFTLEPDFQDVYKIQITDPGTFMIDLTGAGGVNFDACLWLFDADGTPLLGNNDANENTFAPRLTNQSNAGSPITITTPGIYYFAISGFQSQPLQFGKPLWPSVVFEPGVVAGAFGSKGGWNGQWSGDGATGDYLITVTGVSGVPAPGVAALLGVAGLMGRRRRRD